MNKCNKIIIVFAISVLLAIPPAQTFYGQDNKTNITPTISASAEQKTDTRTVIFGEFTVKVPNDWQSFNEQDMAFLRRQFVAQSEEIYRQYSGTSDPSKLVYIIAFHTSNDSGSFLTVSFTVPSQSNLIGLLKSQIKDKIAWGVREGHIRKYLGLISVDNEQFSGFYIKAIGNSGELEISGGIEHKKIKNKIIQFTLLCPKTWDEAKGISTFSSVLNSLTLKEK